MTFALAVGRNGQFGGQILRSKRQNVVSAVFAAVEPLVVPNVHEGLSFNSLSEFADYDDIANYTSDQGAIVSHEIVFTGTITAADDQFAEGDMVGFVVNLEDDQGNTGQLASNIVQAQYLYNIVTLTGNRLGMNINPIVDDAFIVNFGLYGFTGDFAHFNDDYSLSAGYLRSTNVLPGTIKIAFDGLVSDLAVDDTLRNVDGVWVSSTETLTLTRQNTRNDVDITDATTSTYDIVQADVGNSIGLGVTGDDGTNPAVEASADETVNIVPDTLTKQFISSQFNGSDDSSKVIDFSGLGLVTGDTIYVAALAKYDFGARHIDGIRINGGPLITPMSEDANLDATTTLMTGAWFEATLPADITSVTISMESNETPDRTAFFVYSVPDAVTLTDYYAVNDTDSTTVSVNVNTSAGDVILAATGDLSTDAIVWTGVTEDSNRGGDAFNCASVVPISDNASYLVRAVAGVGSDSVLLVLNLSRN